MLPKTVWHRHSAALIELSLTSTGADDGRKRWEFRLDGNTLELTTLDDEGNKLQRITLIREPEETLGVEFTRVKEISREG